MSVFRPPFQTAIHARQPDAPPSGTGISAARSAVVTWASVGFPASGSVLHTGSATLSGQGDLNADGFVSKIVMSGSFEAEVALDAVGELRGGAGTFETEVATSGDVFQTGQGAEVAVSGTAVLVTIDTLLHDSFTDANGTLLTAHTAESGATWAPHPNSSPGVNAVIQSNRVTTGGGSGNALYYASTASASPDSIVTATLRCVTNISFAGILVRVDPAVGGTGYIFMFASGTGWRLGKLSAGNYSFFATGGPTSLTVGQDYVMRFEVIGSQLRGLVDGIEVVTATDATVTQPGKVGIRLGAVSQAAAGYHIDSIDMGVSGAATMTGAGTLTATGKVTVNGSAVLAGAGALTASGTVNNAQLVFGVAALSGAGSLAAVGKHTGHAVASMTGSGQLSAAAKATVRGAASMHGTGSLVARGGRLVVSELDPGSLVLVPMGANGQGLVPLAAGSFTLEEQEKR